MEVADTGAAEWNPLVMVAQCSPTLKLIFSFQLAIHGMNVGGPELWVNFTLMAMPNTQLLTCISLMSVLLPPNQPLPMLI